MVALLKTLVFFLLKTEFLRIFAAIFINTINKHDCFYETILLCHNGDGNVLHRIAGSEQI